MIPVLFINFSVYSVKIIILIFSIRCCSFFCCCLCFTVLCICGGSRAVIGTKNLHTVCVSILNNTYPGLTGIHSDLITVGIIVEGSSPWSVFFPSDIDGLSVYNIFSYIWFINVDVQITVFIVFSPGRILQNDVFIGDLFSGQLINLFVTVLETIVQFVFRIVFKPCSFRKYPGLRHLLLSHPEVPLHHLRRRMHNQAGSPQRIPDCSR